MMNLFCLFNFMNSYIIENGKKIFNVILNTSALISLASNQPG